MSAPRERTAVERAKLESDHLRGTIAARLAEPRAVRFDDRDLAALKHHGIYQQDDRDLRRERGRAGLDRAWSFMLRVAIPGGRLDAAQWLALDDLAERFGGGRLRLTTRQAVQFHGVLLGDLKSTVRAIDAASLSTLAACGDVPRNVMAPPEPIADRAHAEARALARELAAALAPRTGAWRELWLDGDRRPLGGPEEPLLGPSYLPRKFKLGVALAGDPSIDPWTQDAALVRLEDGRWLLAAGGGLGLTHNKPGTIARLADPLGVVDRAHAVAAMAALVAVHRDFGDRTDRRHARLKYLLDERGAAWLRTAVERRIGRVLEAPPTLPDAVRRDWLGAHPQGDGRWFFGVAVESGRVDDRADRRLRAALAQIARELGPSFILTPRQDLLLGDLSATSLDRARAILGDHGVEDPHALSPVRRSTLACVALPTCGLALAEAERVAPQLVAEVERELDRLGLSTLPLSLRITGCPNGCARPYAAELALVGRRPGVYHVYVGGSHRGDRLVDLWAADVPFDDVVARVRPLLERFVAQRRDDEPFGDWYRRAVATEPERRRLTGAEQPLEPTPAATEVAQP